MEALVYQTDKEIRRPAADIDDEIILIITILIDGEAEDGLAFCDARYQRSILLLGARNLAAGLRRGLISIPVETPSEPSIVFSV